MDTLKDDNFSKHKPDMSFEEFSVFTGHIIRHLKVSFVQIMIQYDMAFSIHKNEVNKQRSRSK